GPVNVDNAQTDPALSEARHAVARARGYRSLVAVPLLRQDEVLGAISVTRREAGGFAVDEIVLLQTFADQAVIAIENVRLFTELQEKNQALTQAHAQVTETLDQQTATSEILRVISSSPTDIQPVFDAVVESAALLCAAEDVSIFEEDAGVLRVAAFRGTDLSSFDGTPVSRDSVTGRSMLDRQLVHVHDILQEAEFAISQAYARQSSNRTMLAVPLLREGTSIGAIFIRRAEVAPFSSQQIALLQTFADQAVIAIENVRLFNETKESLEQQTATSEILRVIASSPTDVEPVFRAM